MSYNKFDLYVLGVQIKYLQYCKHLIMYGFSNIFQKDYKRVILRQKIISCWT